MAWFDHPRAAWGCTCLADHLHQSDRSGQRRLRWSSIEGCGPPLPPCPEALIVTLKVSLPSGVFSYSTLWTNFFPLKLGLASPITTFLPLVASAWCGRTSTLGCYKSMVLIGKGVLSICISWKVKRPSFMADWTCRWNTLQSLVAWENELWYLQYACFFNSSSGGIAWVNLVFRYLSNSSNIRSLLETSKVNLISSCRPLLAGLRDEQE
jgi:hypothetical protein